MNVDNDIRALTIYVPPEEKRTLFDIYKKYRNRFSEFSRACFISRKREYMIFTIEYLLFLFLGVMLSANLQFLCLFIHKVYNSEYFLFFFVLVMFISALSGFSVFGRAVPFLLNALIATVCGIFQYSVLFGNISFAGWRLIAAVLTLAFISFFGLLLSTEIFYGSISFVGFNSNNFKLKLSLIYLTVLFFLNISLFYSFDILFNHLMIG